MIVSRDCRGARHDPRVGRGIGRLSGFPHAGVSVGRHPHAAGHQHLARGQEGRVRVEPQRRRSERRRPCAHGGPGRRPDAQIFHMRLVAADERELEVIVALLRRRERQQDAGSAPVVVDRAHPHVMLGSSLNAATAVWQTTSVAREAAVVGDRIVEIVSACQLAVLIRSRRGDEESAIREQRDARISVHGDQALAGVRPR